MANYNLTTNPATVYPPVTGAPADVIAHENDHGPINRFVELFDTSMETAASGQVPKWNGTAWAPAAAGTAAASPSIANVKDYGATGNGSTDDTTAITNAFAVNGDIYFPPGTYVYTGTGLFNGGGTAIQGSGIDKTTIALGAGKVLVAGSTQLNNLLMRDMTISGGAGGVNLANTAGNVVQHYLIENVYFQSYTGTAIGHISPDMPYWKILHCGFYSANNTASIGVALNGLTDLSEIIGCWFVNNRVHIKLGYGGNNAKVLFNDFIQFNAMTAATPRVTGVWVVPKNASTNAGAGLEMHSNKFGNENLDLADWRILYADAVAGSFLTSMFTTGAASTGYVAGHVVTDNLVNGVGTGHQPFVYTTTPNVIGCDFGPNSFGGAAPSYVLQYRTAITGSGDNARNWFGPYRATLYDLFADGFTGITNSTSVGFNRGDRTSVTGSRGGNAALASVLAALVKAGIVVDNTTA